MEPLDVLSVVLRAAAFVATLQAAGLPWFAASCRRARVGAIASVDDLARVSAMLAVLLVVTHRGLDAGRLAGEWSGVLDLHLQGMVWSGRPGLSSIVCEMGLLAVAVGAGRPLRWGRHVGCVGALVVVGSFALTGHTTEASHSGLARGLVALHVGIAAFWVGAVAGLYRLARQSAPNAVAQAAARFSQTAMWLVPLILPVGSLLIWALLPDLSALRTPYGCFLLVKAVGFFGLILLAAMNRLRNLPALAAGAPVALLRFKRVLVAEYVILGSVLAATSTMTSLYSWH